MKHNPVIACFLCALALSPSAYADQVFEAVEHDCDKNAKRLRIHYQEFWNTPAPSNFVSGPGEHQRRCTLDKTVFETNIILYRQGGGTCGATPGATINLRYGNSEIFSWGLNHCITTAIDRLQIVMLKDDVEVTFCGTVYAQSKESQEVACYTERIKRSEMPKRLFSGQFPYEKLVVVPSDLCTSQEKVIFSCRITEDVFKAHKEKLVSLCASPSVTPTSGYLQYRFGKVGEKPELIYPPSREHPKNHFHFGALQSWGGGRYLRFNSGDYSYYVVFTDDPKGVVVEKSGERIAQIPCQGGWWKLDSRPIENAEIPKR